MIETGEIVQTVASGAPEELTGVTLSQGFESYDANATLSATKPPPPPTKPPPKLPEKSGSSNNLAGILENSPPNDPNGPVSPRSHQHDHVHTDRRRSSSGNSQLQPQQAEFTPISCDIIPMSSGAKPPREGLPPHSNITSTTTNPTPSPSISDSSTTKPKSHHPPNKDKPLPPTRKHTMGPPQ